MKLPAAQKRLFYFSCIAYVSKTYSLGYAYLSFLPLPVDLPDLYLSEISIIQGEYCLG